MKKPPIERSKLMGRVRRSGTDCELALRAELHRLGYRYRLRSGIGLPGTPDIVLSRFRIAIFVDGCFWHGCKRHGTVPKTNTKFWKRKILRNRSRDRTVSRLLRNMGWKVLRVWQHDIRSELSEVIQRVRQLAGSS